MRNFFPFISRGPSWREAVDGVPSSTTDGAASGTDSSKSADFVANVKTPHGRASLLVPAWYRGVSLIMQTMGQMLPQYQRINKLGGNFTEDRYGQGRVVNYLLQVRPNPMMTSSQMLEQIEFQKIYNGNAYVYIDRDYTGMPRALWLCTNGSYNVLTDQYTLTYQRRGGAVSITADADDVLHFKNIILDNGMTTGLPVIRFAMNALSIAATADDLALKDFAKGGRQKIIISEKEASSGTPGLLSGGRLKPSEVKRATSEFRDDFFAHDVVSLSNMLDAKVFSQTSAELRILETRGFQVADLSRLLGIPTSMMMMADGVTYKTPEAATQEFLLRTIQPRIREMEDEMNSKLLGPGDFGARRIHICEQALRRLDPAAQANLDKTHLETGAMSVNEIRQQYDRAAVPDGDILYVSTNLAVINSEKLRKPKNSDKTNPDDDSDKKPDGNKPENDDDDKEGDDE